MAKAKPITCDGVTKSRNQWNREIGARSRSGLLNRLKRGWLPCKAAIMPVKTYSEETMKKMIAKRRERRYMRIRGQLIRVVDRAAASSGGK